MLDINFIRENPDVVKKDLEKRKETEKLEWVDDLLEKDKKWRSLKKEVDDLRHRRNQISEKINKVKKKGGDAEELIEKARTLPEKIDEKEEEMEDLKEKIDHYLMRIPNITKEEVPYGEDESENQKLEEYGEKPEFDFKPKNHTEIIEELGLVDLESAAKVSGSRFYYLKGVLAELEMALQKYAVDYLMEKDYELTQPPLMLKRDAYEGVTALSDFEEVMYKVSEEDLYLIATSEHSLISKFKDDVLSSKELPVKLAGISPCFRKESGTHGKEEKGIWRVHHFNKVEQIILCKPEESEEYHEELIKNAVEFFKTLKLNFIKTNICTGDLGIVASKKYDLETWIPSVEEYKEVVSCSNCTSYQSVRLNTRYRDEEAEENKYLHTLNATCVATSRALVAILEQNQNKDGSIDIPEVLQPYMRGKKKIERQK